MINFYLALSDDDYANARILYKEYAASINVSLDFQHFDDELNELKKMYAHPYGGIILANDREEIFACVAVRKISDEVAELKRMYVNNEHLIYYIMAYNEDHVMPAMPEGVEAGIVKGMYRFKASATKAKKGLKANLMGSGSIMQQVLSAAQLLENEGIATDIWSVTSYGELAREATAAERWNMFH